MIATFWITPQEQLDIINKVVMPSDTFVCLGDVGKAKIHRITIDAANLRKSM